MEVSAGSAEDSGHEFKINLKFRRASLASRERTATPRSSINTQKSDGSGGASSSSFTGRASQGSRQIASHDDSNDIGFASSSFSSSKPITTNRLLESMNQPTNDRMNDTILEGGLSSILYSEKSVRSEDTERSEECTENSELNSEESQTWRSEGSAGNLLPETGNLSENSSKDPADSCRFPQEFRPHSAIISLRLNRLSSLLVMVSAIVFHFTGQDWVHQILVASYGFFSFLFWRNSNYLKSNFRYRIKNFIGIILACDLVLLFVLRIPVRYQCHYKIFGREWKMNDLGQVQKKADISSASGIISNSSKKSLGSSKKTTKSAHSSIFTTSHSLIKPGIPHWGVQGPEPTLDFTTIPFYLHKSEITMDEAPNNWDDSDVSAQSDVNFTEEDVYDDGDVYSAYNVVDIESDQAEEKLKREQDRRARLWNLVQQKICGPAENGNTAISIYGIKLSKTEFTTLDSISETIMKVETHWKNYVFFSVERMRWQLRTMRNEGKMSADVQIWLQETIQTIVKSFKDHDVQNVVVDKIVGFVRLPFAIREFATIHWRSVGCALCLAISSLFLQLESQFLFHISVIFFVISLAFV